MKIRAVALITLVALFSAASSGAVPSGASPAQAPEGPIQFNIDPNHSSVEFKVRHLGISRVTGRFDIFEGTFTYDAANVANAKVSVTVDTSSVNTGVERRDTHLRSADFLEVETFPTMTFESTAVRPGSNGNLVIVGDLTLHGVTHSVELETEFLGMAPRRGGFTAAFEGSTRINRHDYGLVWNSLQEGLQLVGDEVDITIQVEANTPREGR